MSTHDVNNLPDAPILVLVRDLMMGSRIAATARAQNRPIKVVRDPQKLADETAGRRLIVDLNQSGALDAAAAWKRARDGVVIGFVSHVDTATIARAREQGIDHVLARSAFVDRLTELLSDPAGNE